MKEGLSFTATMRVTPEVTAEYIGSGDLAVLATPAMCALMENAAMMAVAPHLEEGNTTVGTALNIEHSKATKVGEIITATAVLTEINGRELKFNIAARDGVSIIGEGTHTIYREQRKIHGKIGITERGLRKIDIFRTFAAQLCNYRE